MEKTSSVGRDFVDKALNVNSILQGGSGRRILYAKTLLMRSIKPTVCQRKSFVDLPGL